MAVQENSESLSRGLLEAAPDAVVIVNDQGCIVLVNAQAEKLFGYHREELIGHPIEMLIPVPFRDRHIQDRNTFIAAPQTRPMGVGRELSGLHKNGSLIPVEISLSPMQTDNGRMVISMIRDASERKRVESEMRSLNEQHKHHMQDLLATNQELESFCYSVSHDLRAPLRSLDGFSLALLEDYADVLDDTGKDYLRRLRSSSNQMSQLIDGLLKLSRITRAELHWQDLDISAIARKAVNQLHKAEYGQEADIHIMEGMRGNGDQDLILIALLNLLGNALKFSSKNAAPMIGMRMLEGSSPSVFCIYDNGAGFDMNYADKMFGAFQRLHSQDEFEGTGIGLAIVQRVINRHGGRIWAESQANKGASFYFTLDT